MMTDPIADMLTRIRNASLVHKKEVEIPFSKLKMSVAELLARAGYILRAEAKKDDAHPYILLTLKYDNGQPAIHFLKRVSKPGHRYYAKKEELKPILNGYGMAIISTPRGLLTDADARKQNVGGEVICEVY